MTQQAPVVISGGRGEDKTPPGKGKLEPTQGRLRPTPVTNFLRTQQVEDWQLALSHHDAHRCTSYQIELWSEQSNQAKARLVVERPGFDRAAKKAANGELETIVLQLNDPSFRRQLQPHLDKNGGTLMCCLTAFYDEDHPAHGRGEAFQLQHLSRIGVRP